VKRAPSTVRSGYVFDETYDRWQRIDDPYRLAGSFVERLERVKPGYAGIRWSADTDAWSLYQDGAWVSAGRLQIRALVTNHILVELARGRGPVLTLDLIDVTLAAVEALLIHDDDPVATSAAAEPEARRQRRR
jgi:hypothetical protein